MRELKLVYPSAIGDFSEGLRVRLTTTLVSSVLRAHFIVEQRMPPLTNPSLSGDGWGLWDRDVVELFVSDSSIASVAGRSPASTGLPYYEFVLSPLGQVFQLKIHEPRKKFDRDFRCA